MHSWWNGSRPASWQAPTRPAGTWTRCWTCRSRRVNPNTMQPALAQLETEGLVRTERTSGRYVTEDTELIEQLRTEAARKLAEEFLVKMRGIGYSPARAAALLEQLDTTKEDAQ